MAAVTITKDNVAKVFKSIGDLVGKQVLVGWPADGQPRRGDDGVNNATIAYAMETGLPEHNVPARPSLVPGVNKARAASLRQLKLAAEAALNGNAQGMDGRLHAAGIVAAEEVKKLIQSNIPPPLKPSTIARRYRQRDTKKRRESEQVYLKLVRGGAAPGAAQADVGITALINSGQMLGSVKHVVRKK